jgi:hypothetical protein
MYKLSWFAKIKYKFSEFSYNQTLVFIFLICAFKGYILRTFIIEPTKIYFEIDNIFNGSIILRISETVLYYTLGYFTGLYIEMYKSHWNHFRNDFNSKFAGHLEWEKKGFRDGLDKKGELSQGDVFSILLIDKYINNPYSPIVIEDDLNIDENHSITKKQIKKLNQIISTKDNFKIYMYIRHFTKYKIRNIETSGIIIKGMERIIKNKYIIQKSKERLGNYKEELMQYTWHPDRFIKWCEPNILDKW